MSEDQRAELEGRVREALRDLWPGADGALDSAVLLAHLDGRGQATPGRRLYLLLEEFQMHGLVRLLRGNPARDAHGQRTIGWVNPALLA